MEDANQNQENNEAGPSELEILKSRARLLNIDFSNNIKAETLRQKIADKLEGANTEGATAEPDAGGSKGAAEVNPLGAAELDEEDLAKLSPHQLTLHIRRKLHDEQKKLVRLRITNMDPKKKDLPGEIFTVANEYIGTVSKFIPYGEATEQGYHVPFCLYTMLEEKRFLNIRTTKDKKTGAPVVHKSWAKEFALEVLPQLTPVELKQLATAQMASGSIDNSNDAQIV